jgi:glycosyltransferase involved in cell wall biosynthesis
MRRKRSEPSVTGKRDVIKGRLVIDHTHMRRRATGIERITRELFSPAALSPLPVQIVEASSGRLGVVLAQNATLPLRALRHSDDVFVFPGFPPSPYFSFARRDRTVLYVHDVFLLTRRSELNLAARRYFAPLFSLAVRSLRYFLVNSEYTASTLRPFCRRDAQIMLCRPTVRNVFSLGVGDRATRSAAPPSLMVAAIGTIEPRKNFRAAAEICRALATRLGIPVTLQIVGREGWGADAAGLSQQPHVTLLGALPDREVRAVLEASDLFISTSRDEGLGLPLLEAQYAGLPVIAPDMPVFREVLGSSGLLVNTQDAAGAAAAISSLYESADWRARCTNAAVANVARWNALAGDDHAKVRGFFEQLLTQHSIRAASETAQSSAA